jgi:hypothetical protein
VAQLAFLASQPTLRPKSAQHQPTSAATPTPSSLCRRQVGPRRHPFHRVAPHAWSGTDRAGRATAPHPRPGLGPARRETRALGLFSRRRCSSLGFAPIRNNTASPPRNPSAPPPPSIFRTTALRSFRSRPVAQSQGEEAAGVALWSPRAVYRSRALTGGRRREPSTPPSRAPSPMHTHRPRCKTPDFHRKPESLYHRDSP